MSSACKAIATASAGDMPLAAYNVSGEEVVYVRSNLDNFSDKLMSDGHRHRNRLLRPLVPLINVNISSADTRVAHTNQHIIDADCGFCNVFQPQSALCAALHQCFHEFLSAEFLLCSSLMKAIVSAKLWILPVCDSRYGFEAKDSICLIPLPILYGDRLFATACSCYSARKSVVFNQLCLALARKRRNWFLFI